MKASKRRRAATADELVSLLVDAISKVRYRAHELARDVAGARDLARALDLVCARADDFGSVGSLDLARDLASAFANDAALASTLASSLANDLREALTFVLASDFASTFARDRDRDRTGARAHDLALVRGYVSDLASDLAVIDGLARSLEQLLAAGMLAGQGRAAPLARRLLVIAARLLPAAEQVRYGEEFASELADIVRAGGSRRTQVAYAARLLLRVRQLHSELRPTGAYSPWQVLRTEVLLRAGAVLSRSQNGGQ